MNVRVSNPVSRGYTIYDYIYKCDMLHNFVSLNTVTAKDQF